MQNLDGNLQLEYGKELVFKVKWIKGKFLIFVYGWKNYNCVVYLFCVFVVYVNYRRFFVMFYKVLKVYNVFSYFY